MKTTPKTKKRVVNNLRKGMRVKYRYGFRPHRTAWAWKEGTGTVTGINYRKSPSITIDDSLRIHRSEIVRITKPTLPARKKKLQVTENEV